MVKRHIIAGVFVAVILFGMTGCGSPSIDEGLHIAADDAKQRLDRLENDEAEKEEGADVYEEESRPNVGVQDENKAGDGTGIIAAYTDIFKSSDGNINLVTINPDTGDVDEYRNFTNIPKMYINSSIVTIHRYIFNADYTKLAGTLPNLETGASYAGFIDQSGNFTNVSGELLGTGEGGFSEAKKYFAIGFDKDGYFYFNSDNSYTKDGYYYHATETLYYRVPQDDISNDLLEEVSPDEEIIGFLLTGEKNTGIESVGYGKLMYDISDWVGNGSYLANEKEGFRLCKVGSEESENLLPETNRFCWNGIVSPDKSRAVFMSASSGTTGGTELFIVGMNGGEPKKVDTALGLAKPPFAVWGGFEPGRDYSTEYNYYKMNEGYIIMDWQ